MCGLGDKDRRPISPVTCVQLKIFTYNNVPVDPTSIEISKYVCSVNLYDKHGQQEMNIVKHTAGPGAMSIGASTMTRFPPTDEHLVHLFHPIAHQVQHTAPNGYMTATQQQGPPVTNGFMASQTSPVSNGFITPHQPQPYSSPPQQNPSDAAVWNPHGHYQLATTTAYPMMPTPMMMPQNQSTYSRNLIGSTVVNAARLRDTQDELGIWFVFQDLSIRSEGTFHLKFSFIDLTDHNDPTGGSVTQSRAPILATVMSQSLEVYSAKKFPGVIDSTELNKTFAAQGMKIPIRSNKERLANADEYANDGHTDPHE
jgi:hypothetical protein